MVDVGSLLARWISPQEQPLLAMFSLGGGEPDGHRFVPPREYLLRRLAERSSIDITDICFYQGLAMARVATVLEQRVASNLRADRIGVASEIEALVVAAIDHGRSLLSP